MPEIINVHAENLADYPGVICFINPKNEYFKLKINWLRHRFNEGLKIKILQTEPGRKIAGFIEYVPGEYAWRAISAKNFLFIHCLWVYPNKNKNQGLGSALVKAVIAEARATKKAGVAVITGDGAFMAKKDLFLKNGFTVLAEKNGHQLLAKCFSSSVTPPHFKPTEKTLAKYHGWHLVYSHQCPWVARFVEEVRPLIKKLGLTVTFHELTTAKAAQNAPSIYAVFNLIKDGQLLADRYISLTRWKNIIKKANS